MEEYQQRVVVEHNELVEKLDKLGDFMDSHKFQELNEIQQHLLMKQAKHMTKYANVLSLRISHFMEE